VNMKYIRKNTLFLIINLVIVTCHGISQENEIKKSYTLSGYTSDSSSQEALIGTSIYLPELFKGTTTNSYGFYSITLPEGKYKIRFSYVGYKTITEEIDLNKNIMVNLHLKSSNELDEVEIIANEVEKDYESTEMGIHSLTMKKLDKIPVLLGEKDLIKTLQLLPGVQSGSEGSSGLYVRGGSPDQNLFLLDGVPVYNANHLFGFFSVFNTDAINSVKLIRGGFPARYGGRLSSVLDIRMKEGNMNKFHGSGSIGIISAKINLEGPIIKDKTSFIISGRRTYIDLLAKPLIAYISRNKGDKTSGGYYFYDLNMKINHKFSDKNRLFFSTYLGNDRFYSKYEDNYTIESKKYENQYDVGLGWGNIISVIRWNLQLSPKLFSNTTVTYSRYNFNTEQKMNEKLITPDKTEDNVYLNSFKSGIYDISVKIDFDFMPTPDHYIKFGVGDTYHTFQPGGFQTKYSSGDSSVTNNQLSFDLYAHEYHAYIEDDFKIGSLLKFNVGLHYSGFVFTNKTFNYLQPRLSARILLSSSSSIKVSYSRMAQYLHLLTNPSIGMPTDLWVPASVNAPAEYSDQVSMGYFKQFNKGFKLSIETYYKTMYNLIEYKEGSSFFGVSKNWEDKIEIGKGESYGIEMLIEKKRGKTTGWVGYTLSWANRTFENINFGNTFPYRYDRRHDISIVIVHQLTKNIDLGLVWVYGSGQAVTLGFEEYYPGYNSDIMDYEPITNIDSRNNYRTPAYHRLDLSANFTKKKKWGERTWSVGIYNVYNRQNSFYIYVDHRDNGEAFLQMVSLFPIIPSVAYSFKF